MRIGGATEERQARIAALNGRPHDYRYLTFLPDAAGRDEQRWPLVIFLHGSGERGTNLALVKRHGIPRLIHEGKQFPFVVVAPQCPPSEWWSLDALDALYDEVLAKLPVDPDRVILTGLSMGAYATWGLALRHPQRFAAVAPVCGGGNAKQAKRLRDVPVWTFHGARDDAVPLAETEAMVTALQKHGANVRFTVYPDLGHDSWSRAYATAELYEWMLRQRRKAP